MSDGACGFVEDGTELQTGERTSETRKPQLETVCGKEIRHLIVVPITFENT